MNDLHALASFKALDEGRLQPVDKGVVVTQADVELLAQITEAGGNKAAAFTLRSVGAVGTVLEAQAKAIAHHRHQSETGAALTRDGREALERTRDALRGLQPALNVMAREIIDDIITDHIAPALKGAV